MSEQKTAITYAELPLLTQRSQHYTVNDEEYEETIGLKGVLESLTLFYDEISIPFFYGYERGGPFLFQIHQDLRDQAPPQETEASKKLAQELIEKGMPTELANEAAPMMADTSFVDTFKMLWDSYDDWKERWSPVFKEGIVRLLPPPIQGFEDTDFPRELQEAISRRMEGESIMPIFNGDFALTIHSLRGVKPGPELRPGSSNTEALHGLVTATLATSVIPRVEEMQPEQLLELREHLRDARDAFRAYVSEQLDGIEERIRQGAPLPQAVRQAVDRKMLPKFQEFERQLVAKRVGKWVNIIRPVGEFLRIDASPWTPKFYGDILTVFFDTAERLAKAEEEARTNAGQAFQLLVRLKSDVKRIGSTPSGTRTDSARKRSSWWRFWR